MVSPQINEGMIVGVLDIPTEPEATAQLQSGSVLAIVDGFDRQLQRAEFIRIVTEAVALHGLVGRLESLSMILRLIEQDKLDAKRVREAVHSLTISADHHRMELKKHMELVAQCPWDDDAKH